MSITYEEVLAMKKEQKISLPLMRKDLKMLPDIIDIDESLITFILSNTKPQGILCVTTKRILFISAELSTKSLAFGKNVGLKEVSIPLNKVNSIQSKQQIMYGSIFISDGSQTFTFEKLTAKEVNNFVKLAKEKVANYETRVNVQSTEQSNSNDDKFDEMKKYKELLDQEIITLDEFENKKRELLNL